MIRLDPCPKGYVLDQDKAIRPEETLSRVRERLERLPLSILSCTVRIDNGRLGIPVFLSVCGEDAKSVMPTRKQMGKGATPAQAEASALMELIERYAFFTYWKRLPGARYATWDEAEELFTEALIPLEEVIAACHDDIDTDAARAIMNLRRWLFVPATRLGGSAKDTAPAYIPLDLFKQLGEFNGSSAGNTDVESIFQGACELVERHVCCLADRDRPQLPSIDSAAGSTGDPLLEELLEKFRKEGVQVLLKDFSHGLPVPTVAALAWDPATFPERSEIVFTAGTAASPGKAAIRALTEVAQLAGDFNSAACYEASGLPKYASLEEAAWLFDGPVVPLADLPSVESADMLDELLALTDRLKKLGFSYYVVDTTNPDTNIPTHYGVVPGFTFRERDANASLGLFAGRIISEQESGKDAQNALTLLENLYPGNHFTPFFRGLVALRAEDNDAARGFFKKAEPLQPDADAQALAAFYLGYSYTLDLRWNEALAPLQRAAALCPGMKEYLNFYGVCLFKLKRYKEAAAQFKDIITRLDKGSAVDIQNLGLCLACLGEKREARHYLAAALKLEPGLDAAKRRLAELGQ